MPTKRPAAAAAAAAAADRAPAFLPMTRGEMRRLGWDRLDILLVTGDAYVDHPAFGAPLLGRWLQAHGLRVGIVAQPDWRRGAEPLRVMGAPRLFVGVTAGALDSMLAHYTAFRKKRTEDACTPGGRAGARPNRATIVYAGLARRAFPGVPVIVGGIEASMRRVTHYDFWSDSLRKSILLDSKADLLVYGMAERALLELARRLQGGEGEPHPATRLQGIAGTAWEQRSGQRAPEGVTPVALPSHEAIAADPKALMTATLLVERQAHEPDLWLEQATGRRRVLLAPPAVPLDTAELDALYALPFARQAHPACGAAAVPAEAMIRFSLTSHRGCAGGCTFCSLAMHQGRTIRSRSGASILDEARRLTAHPLWRGSVSDVGGPTANMWGAGCRRAPGGKACRRSSCLWPGVCRHFDAPQSRLADLLDRVAALPGVKHVRTASGIRHDLALGDARYVHALLDRYVGGQLKLAPEHCSGRVLAWMRKPPFEVFETFLERFDLRSTAASGRRFVVPYLLSAFPGCTEADMRALARWLKARHWRPQQVQCFIPTPGTVATAMFHAGIDADGNTIHVARSDRERMRQHRLLAGSWGRSGRSAPASGPPA